jgi:pentatricopeptide repeat protein
VIIPFFISFLFLSESIPLSAKASVPEDKLNLLLITIDTLRTDRLSCYSSEHVKTPNIDSLAAKSVVFNRAFAHTSTTLPSHTNILLGMIPPFHGVHDNLNFRVKDDYLTLAEHLKKEGYSTGAFVGAFPLKSLYGLDQGFDIYDDEFGLTEDGKQASERPAEIVIDNALRYLDQTSSPWFLWIHCYDPHDPYEPPQPFATEYKTSPYDGEVAYVDFALKKLFGYLEIQGLFGKTMIVLTGDHGESLGEHGEKTHSFFAYNSTIWIPLLIHVPGIKSQTIPQNVSHIDLFPTVCSALKIETPPNLAGVVLLPLKKKSQMGRTIYFESLLPFYNMGWAPIRGIIQDKSKFVDSPLHEFYDLEKDFDELKNLSHEKKTDLYRKQLVQILQNQGSGDKGKTNQLIDRDALNRLKSLGYVGDYLGETKKSFGPADDVKELLPFYNKTQDALDLLHEAGKVEEATILLKEVITETKRYPLAFINLAKIYKDQNRLSDAIQVLRLGSESIPESFQLYSTLIEYLFEANQWNEIIAVFQRMSFERSAFDPIIWNLVGTAYANIGDFDNALMCCERAVSIDETYPVSYNNLGWIHFTVFNLSTNPSNLEKALLYYQKAIELDSKISAAHNGIGLIFMYKQNYDQAIYHLETALKLQSDLESVLYNLGMANLKAGYKASALSFFNRFKLTQSYKYLPSSDKAKLEDLIRQCKEIPFPD